ncbi:MAG: trigger factor, partial [Acidobacteria bacterium]|nr:trigger factor [Acidobacteriota bacterium]
MPGFRPGKVPRRILETRYKSEVEADVARRLQYKAVVDAIREHKVPALGEPRFTGGKLSPGQPFAFQADCDVKPDVEVKEWKGLALKRFDAAVGDAQVDEQLTRLQDSRATVEPVEGRTAVQTGDMVAIDFDATIDGKPFPGSSGRDYLVEVSAGELHEGKLPQLAGGTVGQPKVFDYTFPDGAIDEVKGKTASFNATIKAIQVRKVPALDDAFAQGLGLESLAALKTRIRKDLERSAKGRIAVDERENVFKALADKNAFEVPNSLIESGVDMLLEGAFQQMYQSGMDPRQLSLDWGKLRETLRPKSELEARGQLLIEALTKAEKLEVSDGDVTAKLASLAEESGREVAELEGQYKNPERLAALKQRLLEEKAMALVKQHAKYE